MELVIVLFITGFVTATYNEAKVKLQGAKR